MTLPSLSFQGVFLFCAPASVDGPQAAPRAGVTGHEALALGSQPLEGLISGCYQMSSKQLPGFLIGVPS